MASAHPTQSVATVESGSQQTSSAQPETAKTAQQESDDLAREMAAESRQPILNSSKENPHQTAASAAATLAMMYHVKVRVAGYSRLKHAVMIPDNVAVDAMSIQQIFEHIDVPRPHTVIQGCCGGRNPKEMLIDAEAAMQKLEGLTSKTDPETINKILANKCCEIMYGLINALRETCGMCFHRDRMGLFENLVEVIKQRRGLHENSIASMHLNSKDIKSSPAQAIALQLLEAVSPTNHMGSPVGEENVLHLGAPDAEIWNNTELPSFAADVFLCFYKPNANANGTAASKDFDVDVSARRQFDERCFGATLAFIFMNGAEKEKNKFLKCCEDADPVVIIKNTGGIAAQIAELCEIIADLFVYPSTAGWSRLSDLVEEKYTASDSCGSWDDAQKWQINKDAFWRLGFEDKLSNLSLERIRIRLVQQNGRELEALARKKPDGVQSTEAVHDDEQNAGCVQDTEAAHNDEQDSEHAEKNAAPTPSADFTIPDIIQVFDIVKMRKNKFRSTTKVVDPLMETPEQAMNRLSSCLDSTDIGPVEIGAHDAHSKVVKEAWGYHQILMSKLDEVSARFNRLSMASAFFLFASTTCSVLLAILRNQSDECQDCVRVGKAVVIIIPMGVSFLTTVVSSFQLGTRKAKLVLAGAKITREIFMFRGHVAHYSVTGLIAETQRDTGNNDTGDVGSDSKRSARILFVKKLNEIFVDTAQSMNDDTLLGFDLTMQYDEGASTAANYITNELPLRLYAEDKDGKALPSSESSVISVVCWFLSCCFCDGRNSYTWCSACQKCWSMWCTCLRMFPFGWCRFCAWLCRKAHWCRWCRQAVWRRCDACRLCMCGELPDPETGAPRTPKPKVNPTKKRKGNRAANQALLSDEDPGDEEEKGVTYTPPLWKWKVNPKAKLPWWRRCISDPSQIPYPECSIPAYWYTVPQKPVQCPLLIEYVVPPSSTPSITFANTEEVIYYCVNEDKDDFCKFLNSTDYFKYRVMPSLRKLARESPTMANSLQLSQIIIFLSGIVASIFGAMDLSLLIPIVTGISTLVTTMMHFNGFSTRLAATNGSLAVLQAKRTYWQGLSEFERRNQKAKEDLIVAVENAIFEVEQSIAAVSAAASGSDRGKDDSEHTARQPGTPQAAAKAKAKPAAKPRT